MSNGSKPGRKKKRPEDKRVNVTLSISPVGRQIMSVLMSRGHMISREFDAMIMHLAKKEGLVDSKGGLVYPPKE